METAYKNLDKWAWGEVSTEVKKNIDAWRAGSTLMAMGMSLED